MSKKAKSNCKKYSDNTIKVATYIGTTSLSITTTCNGNYKAVTQ